MVCCTDGSADLARLLLQNGADTKVKNSTGETVHTDVSQNMNHVLLAKKTDLFRSVKKRFLSLYGLYDK